MVFESLCEYVSFTAPFVSQGMLPILRQTFNYLCRPHRISPLYWLLRSFSRHHLEQQEQGAQDMVQNATLIAHFGKEDTAAEPQSHAARTQDTLMDAVENAEVAEIKRAVFAH